MDSKIMLATTQREGKLLNSQHNKITIGLLVYNEERYLEETLISILNQTYRDFSVIISDNASDDSTPKIAKRFCEIDSRFKYHRHENNLGAIKNYWWVVDYADTEYFVLAGGHDLWPTNYLTELVRVLESESDAVLAYAPTEWIDEINQPLDRKTGYIDTRGKNVLSRFNMTIWTDQHALYGLFRLKQLKEARARKEIVGNGAVLLAELALKGEFLVAPTTKWNRRVIREEKNREEAMKRYAKALFSRKRMPLFPHWRIPLEHIRIIMHARVSYTEKLLLFFSIGGVFTRYFVPLLADIKNLARFRRYHSE
jgi:glycosyltransferase involved in cell wall biosynthesis